MTELNAQPEASPAEILRAAATLLRETASNATPVDHITRRWSAYPSGTVNGTTTVVYRAVDPVDAAWIALTGPQIAEPLADWLEGITERHSDAVYPGRCQWCVEPWPCPDLNKALAVARAITGRKA